MTQSLSTEIVTHKLKIEGMETKYISRKVAESIFGQIVDTNVVKVTILNPETLTFISKYKSEIELLPLEGSEQTLEDILYRKGIENAVKAKIRAVIADRIKNGLPVGEANIQNIIEKYTNG